MVAHLKNERGQTSVEYLLLLTVAFITAYFVVTGPLSLPTRYILVTIRSGIANTVRNGEWKEGQIVPTGAKGHPGDPARFQALHL